MKNTLLAGLFLLVFGTLQAQSNSLREVVAIVRPVYSESTVNFLNSFAEHLDKQGYDSLGVQLKRYAKGNSFGSGFAYMNPTDSQTYILTNSHVVAQAQTVNVEFALEDQSVKTFNNCKIIAVDYDNDLALVSLPQGVKLDRVLQLSARNAEDAEDVFTAGYPGLADKPSWQLGKGIISNASIHVDGWIASKDAIIQHTAQIDPGSSGGPLLRRNSNAPRNYEIVGMNTWKVRGRENANFSIPISLIKRFIDQALNGPSKLSKEALQQQAVDFLGVAKDGYKRILPYVSYEYIAKLPLDQFFEQLGTVTPEVKKEVLRQFGEMNPIEGVRVMISSIIALKIAKQELTFESIEKFSSTAAVTVNFKQKDKTIPSFWVIDQGQWRLSDLSSVKFVDDRMVKIDNSYGYSGSITYVKNTDLIEPKSSYSEILTQYTRRTFYTSGVGLTFGKMYHAPSEGETEGYTTSYWGVLSHGGVQLPVKVGPVHLVPYARILVGSDMTGDLFDFNVYYGYRLGLEANLHLTGDSYLITGVGYHNKTYFFPQDLGTLNSLSLFVGITY